MEKQNKHRNNTEDTDKFHVPFEVDGTNSSALGGTSPEMSALTKLTTKLTQD
ncbi:hypothetical protein SOV_19270 [Sporomusa ovata DSM 2662]|uniref:Uncharacterized protein n=1 Tax=Sporomusa ovata TaxID=2378 RepID=A0A0U1KXE0_9FIRM|nr:hypothetical protein [Sporomusa ovata]EQB29525.1 hypothetical protein SOV_1c12590 [Sporomusa ovata DSM 2662]CQR72036.1 hypothetical protein SpAn4DRAFT_4725 [Sporomusa ovata]